MSSPPPAGRRDTRGGCRFTSPGAALFDPAFRTLGPLFQPLRSQNRVEVLSQDLQLLQEFTVPSPDAIAVDNGNAYVHQFGTPTVSVLSVPEPSGACGLVMAAAGLLARRRRR